MRWLVVLIPVFAILLLAGWVLDLDELLLERTSGDEAASAEGDDLDIDAPSLQGRARLLREEAEARSEEDEERFGKRLDGAPGSLHGRVIVSDGQVPLRSVIVWQAPKRSMDPAVAASIEWANARGIGGRDGRFVLPVVRRLDTWIGVRVPGRRTVFLDGATIDWDARQRVELAGPIQLEVTVLDREGAPHADEVLRAVPRTQRGRSVPYGAPDDPLQTQIATTDELGRARFTLERDVTVDVSVVDRLTNPPTLVLSAERPEGVLREAAPAKLFLDVLDEKTGKHLEEALTLFFFDAAGAVLDFEIRTDDSADEIETDLPFPPGTYRIQVNPRTRPSVLVPDITIDRYGVEIRRSVRVPPSRGSATVAVRVPGASLDGAYWMLGRRDGAWADLGWTRVELRLKGTDLHLEPGTWSAVLVLPSNGDVCVLPTQTLEEGQSLRLDASPRQGDVFPLYAYLPPDLEVRSLRIEVSGLGTFQATGRTAKGRELPWEMDVIRAIDAPGSPTRKDATAGPVLGPYPEGVVVVVKDEHGVEHRLPVR